MKRLVLFLIPLSGCVSLSYHQKKVAEAQQIERARFMRYMVEVKKDLLPVDTAIKLLNREVKKEGGE